MEAKIDIMTGQELKALSDEEKEQLQILDIRTDREAALEGKVPGAIRIPYPELEENIDQLDPTKKTVVYCKVGYRSYDGCKVLQANGFKDMINIIDGYFGYHYGDIDWNL